MRILSLMAACTLAASMLVGCGKDEPKPTATASSGTTPAAARSGAKQIAVIPKGTTHVFWKSIHAGADKAAAEATAKGTSVNVIWKGPLKEDDSVAQSDVVDGFLNQSDIAGIVLAPNDFTSLKRVVDKAAEKHVPVVIIDSDVNSQNYASFVATDNEKGGELGGERLAEVLGKKGRVIMLRYMEGSASTEKREAGFLKTMAKYPDIKLLSTNQFAGATSDSAQTKAENLLAGFISNGEAQFDGIFCPNESSASGMLRALQRANIAGKVKYVAFDASDGLVKGLESGQIQGLVLQNPVRMGYDGVNTMLDVLAGKKVDKRIDTGVEVATPENMKDKKIADLLHPPIQ